MIFRAAALLIDGWLGLRGALRALPRADRLRAAWRALPGDAIGFLVMRGCGIDRPNRTVETGGLRVAVVEHPAIGRWFRLNLIPVSAQTLGCYVIAAGPIPDGTMEHEFEHIRQWSRLGPLYLPLYFGSSALQVARGRRPYWDNAFEVAARRRAEQRMAELGAAG
jgi:hypothetical protein